MAAGLVKHTVLLNTGEEREVFFWALDTGAPNDDLYPVKALTNAAGALVAFGSGVNGATVPRVALATDSPGVTALGQTTKSASLPVTVASDDVVQASPQPLATGGLSIFRSLDMDESEEEVKATAGCLYKLRITNFAAATRYVKLYNATAANVTVGTTTPVDTVPICAGETITESFGGVGLAFATAISIAATTGLADNDTGAPGTNDVIVSAYYK